MIVLVQWFGLKSPGGGGGARILRALFTDAPMPWLSIVAGTEIPPAFEPGSGLQEEIHLPMRPHLGRIERTRFSPQLYPVEQLYAPRFIRRMKTLCQERKVTGIHALAHTMDFWYSFQVAQSLGLPYYLSVHDDVAYNLKGRPECGDALAHLSTVWKAARARFVISEQLGQEYCKRYGTRPYVQVTDGLATIPTSPRPQKQNHLRVYFMGLFHRGYITNFRALLNGLVILQERFPDWKISVTCRCGTVPHEALTGTFDVTQLPFASEAQVAQDMAEADLLYLPLPFGAQYDEFVRFSLSTKMISYLGSALPILYHGPTSAAAGSLLAQHGAALVADTLEPEALADILSRVGETGRSAVESALALGRDQFLLDTQRERFWSAYQQR